MAEKKEKPKMQVMFMSPKPGQSMDEVKQEMMDRIREEQGDEAEGKPVELFSSGTDSGDFSGFLDQLKEMGVDQDEILSQLPDELRAKFLNEELTEEKQGFMQKLKNKFWE